MQLPRIPTRSLVFGRVERDQQMGARETQTFCPRKAKSGKGKTTSSPRKRKSFVFVFLCLIVWFVFDENYF